MSSLACAGGKGGYDRLAAFDGGAAAALVEWVGIRKGLDVPPGSPVFKDLR